MISSSNVNNGDGKTYIMILAALLIATIVLGIKKKNSDVCRSFFEVPSRIELL